MYKIGSSLDSAKLSELRPTQMTVGFDAVDVKRRELRKQLRDGEMRSHVFPAVKGPAGKKIYILDGHHEALALLQEGVEEVALGIVCDLTSLRPEDFWTYLDHRAWMHCYDNQGKRREFSDMPAAFEDLQDDPYRSLAAAVLSLGGFAKPEEPFYEFLWANHFRRHFELEDVRGKALAKTAKKAVLLARASKSKFLPGWAGQT